MLIHTNMITYEHGSLTGLSRRSFLHTAGLAAAAASVSPLGSSAAESRWTMRLAASSIGYTKLPVEDAFQRIADLGFEAIDIWSAHAGCPHLDDVLKRLGPDGLKTLLAKHRLKLCAFSVYVGGYPKYAELLGQMGGGVAVRGSAGPCKPADLAVKMKAFLESLKPLLELCDKYQSSLAIENHANALLDSPDSFKAFTDLNTHPRLGLALAPYHVQALGASVEQVIEICGRQLLFFYAWQKADGVNQLPGHGPVDCVPWLRALARINYPHYVTPFMHHEPPPDEMTRALAKSRDYLIACVRP